MDNPLVTIIIPFFNPGSFFPASLKSLEKLDYSNIEFIFVDDGSTDHSVDLLKCFSRNYTLLSQANKGVLKLADTLNSALNIANGKYVQMFPSDDIIYSHKLGNQVEILEKNQNVVLVFSDMHIIDEDGVQQAISYAPSFLKKNISYQLSELRDCFFWNYFLPQPTTLIRVGTLRAIGGFLQPDGLFAEDMPTHLELLKYGDFYYQNGFTAAYRIHSRQMTNKHAAAMMSGDFCYIKKWFISHLEKSKHNFRVSCMILLKSYFVLFRISVGNPRSAHKTCVRQLGLSVLDPFIYFIIITSVPIFILRSFLPEYIRFRSRRTCKP